MSDINDQHRATGRKGKKDSASQTAAAKRESQGCELLGPGAIVGLTSFNGVVICDVP